MQHQINNCKASVSQFWMTMNTYLNRFRSVKCSTRAMSWNSWDISMGIFPSLVCFLTKQHGIRSGKYLLKTPGNVIPETLNFKMSLDASALKNLCPWCKLCLLFITTLLLKNFLTALVYLSWMTRQDFSEQCYILEETEKLQNAGFPASRGLWPQEKKERKKRDLCWPLMSVLSPIHSF